MVNAPVALIWLEIIPFEYRFHAFSCVLTGFIYFYFLRRYRLHELGFRTDNLNRSLGLNFLFCAAGAIARRSGTVSRRNLNPLKPSLYFKKPVLSDPGMGSFP